ncbi:hypothetical protein RB601_008271 [Gaeumannomyces tritici]
MGFKAIIVGGGVGGLTLANVFEQLNIDYVLLEAYGDFTPEVGASIAMLPNGLRILDQIGCRAAFSEGVHPIQTVRVTRQGVLAATVEDWSTRLIQRHGQGVEFHDRRILLQALLGGVKNKERLLLNKRVCEVTTDEDRATVETADGHRYEGDVVVGLDGIRSTVRDEMRRLAAEQSLGYFPDDEWKRVPIEYRCIFGIGKGSKYLPPGSSTQVIHQGCSYLVLGGPPGKTYFFLVEKLPEIIYADKTPKYSEEETKAFVDSHRNDMIIEGCSFGDVFDNHTSFGITPLHEHAFEKWHYGRIITLGDAAHKVNPIAGQGGNAAMESVAAFVNNLKERLDALPSPSASLSAADIHAVFRDTQDQRLERAREVVTYSRTVQKTYAMEGKLGMHMTHLLPLLLSQEKLLESWAAIHANAVKVEALPEVFRPHYVPFTSELPAKPIRNAKAERAVTALALGGLTWLAGHGIRKMGPLPEAMLGQPFRKTFTGLGVDRIFSLLTKIFAVSLASPVPEQRLQLVYFVPMLAPTVLIWLVEAHRRGNSQTLLGRLLTWPGFTAVLYQLLTVARVGPAYFLSTLLITLGPLYHRTGARSVDPDVARALLPAVALGYVVPSALMLLPASITGAARWQDFITLWQVAPVVVGPITSLIASGIRRVRRALSKADEPNPELEMYKNKDVPHLLTAYKAAAIGTAAVHVGFLGYVLSSPTPSLPKIFGEMPWPWSPAGARWEVGLAAREVAFALFKRDLFGFAAANLVWCLHSVFDMRRLGYVTTAEAARAALAVPASLLLLGPGAMYAGTWYWREKTIAGLSRMEAGDEKKKQ